MSAVDGVTEVSMPRVSAMRAGSVTTMANAINVLLGFAFQSLIAWHLGLTHDADRFQLTWAITTIPITALFTMVPSYWVPRLVMHGYGRRAWYDSVVIGLVISIVQALTGWALFGPLGPSPDSAQASSIYYASISGTFAAVACLNQAQAYYNRQFFAAAISPAINGAGVFVAASIVAAIELSSEYLGLAIAFGYALQAVLTTRLRPFPGEPTVHYERTLPNISKYFAFSLFTRVGPLVERFLTAGMLAGSTAAFGFGQRFAQGLLMMSALGLSVVSMPAMTSAVRSGRSKDIDGLLGNAVAATGVATAVTLVLALPAIPAAVHFLLEHGAFSSAGSTLVSWIAIAQLGLVIGNAMTGPLTGALYSASRLRDVAFVATTSLGTLVVAGLCMRKFGVIGISGASSVAAIAALACAYRRVCKWRGNTWWNTAALWRSLRRPLAAAPQAILGLLLNCLVWGDSLALQMMTAVVSWALALTVIGGSRQARESILSRFAWGV